MFTDCCCEAVVTAHMLAPLLVYWLLRATAYCYHVHCVITLTMRMFSSLLEFEDPECVAIVQCKFITLPVPR